MDAMIKLFRCSFCERGFSNAQALGGHMNIHRKDRAKLIKEFSDENFLSLDIAKSVDLAGDEEVKKATTPDEESRDLLVMRCKHDSVRGLQLFAVSEKNKVELIHGGVDLELRLGPQPHHEAKINIIS